MKTYPYDAEKRRLGLDWPGICYTMVGHERLENLRYAIGCLVKEKIPGDLVECGVWRGGAAIFMAAVLKELGEKRTIWLADSFEGLPAPTLKEDEGYDVSGIDYLAVGLEDVEAAFKRFDLLDSNIRFLKGWFSDTLPTAPIEPIALLRLDGDLYASTMDALTALYDRLSPGAFVIVDDYGTWEPCRRAVEDFLSARGVSPEIHDIDGSGVYWRA
jgi:O-methyltransferase